MDALYWVTERGLAGLDGLRSCNKLLHESLIDTFLDENARFCSTDLATMKAVTSVSTRILNISELKTDKAMNELLTAFSRSASSKMMMGLLPPSSSDTRFRFDLAAISMIFRPTSVLPVNATLPTFGCSTIAWPATGPYPGSTLSTPGGIPACFASSASLRALRGVSSDGLRIIQLPVARHGAIFQQALHTMNLKSGHSASEVLARTLTWKVPRRDDPLKTIEDALKIH